MRTKSAARGRPVAIVTGSSSGIGRAIATRLAADGYDLILHGLSESDELRDAQKAVEERGARSIAGAGDVCDPEVPRSLVDLARSEFGRLDVLVNNAGTGLTKSFIDITDDDWMRVNQMHLGAARCGCQNAMPLLANTGGCVVNISSLAAALALPGRVGYGTVKAAVEGFTRALACEWAPIGIRVNAIAPGTILTPLVESNFERGLLDEAAVLERTPMGRLGKPGEIAGVASFLASPDASYLTGQILRVDGGWSVWGGWS